MFTIKKEKLNEEEKLRRRANQESD